MVVLRKLLDSLPVEEVSATHAALWIGLALSLPALVVVSMMVEAMRKKPIPPAGLPWGPAIPILYTDINGVRARYIRTGAGPTLLLLHTLRTQLDIFQKVIPTLAQQFTVYAVDYPGHGWSDIPRAVIHGPLGGGTTNRAASASISAWLRPGWTKITLILGSRSNVTPGRLFTHCRVSSIGMRV